MRTANSGSPAGGPAQDAPVAGSVARSRPCVGPQIRHWRRQRGLTLTQVAARSALNVGYLSQIENDKASPSLESLQSLAIALDVPITWFLVDTTSPPRVVRASERRSWAGPGGIAVEEVDGGIPRDVRIITATSAPGQHTGMHAHAGDEHHIVLSGRCRLTQGAHTVDLGPGDYVVWDGTVPHDSEGIGDEPVTVLIISHHSHGAEATRPGT